MAGPNSRYTLTDALVAVVSPVLIMALVGSLVFFLIEIFYEGLYPFKVQQIFFFYVFGAVLVSRLSMSAEASSRSGFYGLLLAGAAFLALQMFVDYSRTPLQSLGPAVNVGLILLVWWCAYQLTWDCTFQHPENEAGGTGVLQGAGLDRAATEQRPAAVPPAKKKEKRGKKQLQPPAFHVWWTRYSAYREERNRKHTPGTWVVYFSLAALPLFGLGQARIPAEDAARRQFTFWLMVCYVGSGLGLLLATQFLGLRRYLQQRGVRMPASIVARWLTMGIVLIVTLLTVGALLPRPTSEYSLLDLGSVDSEKREPTQGPGSGADGEKGNSGKQSSAGQSSGSASSSGSDGSGGKGQGGSSGSGNSGRGKSGSSGSGKGSNEKSGGSGAPQNKSVRSPSNWLAKLGIIGVVLKWIVLIIAGLAIAFIVLRAALQFMAGFTDWAARLMQSLQSWWSRLFGWWGRELPMQETAPAVPIRPPRAYAVYANPFLNGQVNGMAPEEVVRYTFEAVSAWAAERELGRQPEETPLEFAVRLGDEVPALADQLEQLAALYARMAYGGASLSESVLPGLKQLWKQLDTLDRRAVAV